MTVIPADCHTDGIGRNPARSSDPSSEMSEQPEHPGYELAFQEGLRAITQQQAVLDGLHRRAGTLLAVASIVTSFLGSLRSVMAG